jgi:disulfide oxidoreductase YuzD
LDNIKIVVYGGTNTGGGGCGCGCTTCTPADAKAEYEIMHKELLSKYGPEMLSIEFIDTSGVKLSSYPEVEKIIRAGYSFPITVIDGSPRLAGSISVDSVIEIITELQNQK